MKIIKPSAVIKYPKDAIECIEMLELVEEAARICYKSEDKMGDTYNRKFIKDKIQKGHLSVLEHSLVTVLVTCDRGVSHELVRHRIASYSQESTRYCNYSKDQFGNEITVIKPAFFEEGSEKYIEWVQAMNMAEHHYFSLLSEGATPQEARTVLPNSLKTEIMISMNFREWRHFFNLRLSEAAHPQMREVANLILIQVKEAFPIIFEDFEVKYEFIC